MGNIRRVGGKIQSSWKTRDQTTCDGMCVPKVIEAGSWGHGNCTGPLPGASLVQSYSETGSRVIHDDDNIPVSVHTSSPATGLAQGEGQVWHTHSREVWERDRGHEGKPPNKVSFLCGINKWPLLLLKE